MRDFAFRRCHQEDFEAVRQVLIDAFGRPDEADLTDALRRNHDMAMEFVALKSGVITGYIGYSNLTVTANGCHLKALALAPLAVSPQTQNAGFGRELSRRSLRELEAQGYELVVVLGHPSYYPALGFSAVLAKQLDAPFKGPSFQAMELKAGCLARKRWMVRYAAPFAV